MHAAEPSPGSGHKPREDTDSQSKDHAVRFLDFLFQGLARGYVEFQHLAAGRRHKLARKPLFVPLPLDPAAVIDEVLSGDERPMVAVGPAPRFRVPKGGRAGKDHDILRVGCLWANLSYGGSEGSAIDFGRRLREFPLRPSITVNSGHGRQVYFALNDPLSDGRLLNWDELMQTLRDALGGTDAISIAQTLLLPGCLNLRDPLGVMPCRLDDEDSSWLRYSLEELSEVTKRACELKKAKQLEPPARESGAKILPATFQERGVPQEVVQAIVTGRISSSGGGPFVEGRDFHERDLWIATTLLDYGFNHEEVKEIFRSNPGGCGSRLTREKNAERYLELMVKTASGLRRRQGRGGEGDEDEGEGYLELPPGYETGPGGSIWLRPARQEGDRKDPRPVKVADSYIGIAGIREEIDTGQISLIIECEYLGRRHTTTIQRSQMADSRQLVSALSGRGAPVTSINARQVISYLAACEHAFGSRLPRTKVTSRFGRGPLGGPFFLPGVKAGVEFLPSGDGDASLYRAYSSRRGSLKGWVALINTLAEDGLMIPQVAVLAAFVPPLQARLQIPNFILDINGGTSTGKSTSLKLAASVYGSFSDPDSLVMQWMNTQAAVEQLAGVCSDLPVFLDDAQHCTAELKRTIIYMIANGRGKGRAAFGRRGGGITEITTWRTVALSTSEEPLSEASPHEGARGRILPVGGAVHPFPRGSGSLVQSLERRAALNHGYAGETYIRHINSWTDSDWSRLQSRYQNVRREFQTSSSSNLMGRVSGYVAAVQLAAEIACPLLGLKFKPEAVGTWLMLHLAGEQSSHNLVMLALRALADFYVANLNHFAGDGGYSPGLRVPLYGVSRRQRYVGFLRGNIESIFKSRKWGTTALLNKMADAGVLLITEPERHTKKVAVEGVKHRMVCVKWTALLPEESEG